MTRETMPCSAIAKELKPYKGFTKKYPWDTMDVYTSFHVSYSEAKFATIRNSASKMGKKLNRKFRAVDHGSSVGIEVVRLPVPVDEMPPIHVTAPKENDFNVAKIEEPKSEGFKPFPVLEPVKTTLTPEIDFGFGKPLEPVKDGLPWAQPDKPKGWND